MPLRRPHFVAPASCRLFSLVPVLLFPFARHPINPLAIMETVQPSLIAVQPSFSTIRCKTLNIFIKVCYAPPFVTAMPPRRRLSTFLYLITTPVTLTAKSHRIISFADPHPLTLLKSYRFENRGREGAQYDTLSNHLQFSVPTSKFRIPQILCLLLLRKHRGVWGYSSHFGSLLSAPLRPLPSRQRPYFADGSRGSGAIGGVDADVFRGEIASPVARAGFAGVQIHNQRNVFGEEFVARGAFIEIDRLAASQYRDAGHLDVHKGGVKLHSGAPGGGKNAAPVGVAACESGFDQRRSRNGFGNALRSGFGFRVADFDFDDALRAFAVGNNLKRERSANFFQSGGERTMRRGTSFDRGRACFAVGKNQQRVVCRSVAVHADGVEGAAGDVAQRFLQKGRSNRRIRGDKRQHGRHVRVNHARAFRAAHEMNSLAGHLERS